MSQPVPQMTMTVVVEGQTYEVTRDVQNVNLWQGDKRAFEFELNETYYRLRSKVITAEFPPPV
jgi:hypothetical protein